MSPGVVVVSCRMYAEGLYDLALGSFSSIAALFRKMSLASWITNALLQDVLLIAYTLKVSSIIRSL